MDEVSDFEPLRALAWSVCWADLSLQVKDGSIIMVIITPSVETSLNKNLFRQKQKREETAGVSSYQSSDLDTKMLFFFTVSWYLTPLDISSFIKWLMN